jgi:hypothetical protein
VPARGARPRPELPALPAAPEKCRAVVADEGCEARAVGREGALVPRLTAKSTGREIHTCRPGRSGKAWPRTTKTRYVAVLRPTERGPRQWGTVAWPDRPRRGGGCGGGVGDRGGRLGSANVRSHSTMLSTSDTATVDTGRAIRSMYWND